MIRLIIRKCEEYFLIKVFKDEIGDFNIFDMDDVRDFFQSVFDSLRKKYDLHGLIDVDVYVNDCYGMIIEMMPIDSYFDEIDMRIKMHLSNVFLVEIDNNSILDYEDVYYYDGKFYGNYRDNCDSEVLYKETEDIMNKGIKVI